MQERKNVIIQKQFSWIIAVYFALKPVYLWSSGMPQISDFFLVVSLFYLIVSFHGNIYFSEKGFSAVKLFSLLTMYQFTVNLIWSMITSDLTMVKVSLYYVFNLIAFAMCLLIGVNIGTEGLKKSIVYGSFVSILVTMLGIATYSGSSSRNVGFFNNPNQLGYYAVIMMTVILYCRKQLNKPQKVILFLGSAYAAIASLSKAAIIGYLGLLIIYILFFQEQRNIKKVGIKILLMGLFLGVVYLLFYADNNYILSNNKLYLMRYKIIHMMEENDSNLNSGRGYGRIFELGFNFLWGMGEGDYNRFLSRPGAELHSTFVNLLVSYGLIGLTGYLYLFKSCMGKRKKFINSLVILSGLFLYSITHNGVRNTLLWIILATMLLENAEKN